MRTPQPTSGWRLPPELPLIVLMVMVFEDARRVPDGIAKSSIKLYQQEINGAGNE